MKQVARVYFDRNHSQPYTVVAHGENEDKIIIRLRNRKNLIWWLKKQKWAVNDEGVVFN